MVLPTLKHKEFAISQRLTFQAANCLLDGLFGVSNVMQGFCWLIIIIIIII